MFLRTVASVSGLVRFFGKQTRRSTIPRILKDPNYTESGFRHSGPQRKQYDLEGVANAHLYYNKKEDLKADKKRRRLLEVARRREPAIEDQSIEAIVADLTNHDLVLRGSGKIFLRIGQLEKLHADKLEEHKGLIGSLLSKLAKNHVQKFNRRELGLFLVYLRKYRNPIPLEEFTPVLLNTIGLIRSDFYNGKSGLEEARDEQRLAIYIGELHRMYSVNLNQKLDVIDSMQKGFEMINEGLAPHAGKFREAGSLFIVVSALSCYTKIKPELVQQVKKVFKPTSKPDIINGYLSIVRGQPVDALKDNLQAMFNFVLNQPQVSSYYGLKDFIETLSVTPAVETQFAKEIKQLVAKLDSEVQTTDFGVCMALVHLHGGVLSKIGAGQVSRPLQDAFHQRAEAVASTFSKESFYRYFYVCQHSKSVSVKVIETFLAIRTKDSSYEWGAEQLETLHGIYKDLQSTDEGVQRFKEELETDLALFQAQLDDRKTRGQALRRI